MANVTIVQQARTGTVKPLLASRIKAIISREDLKQLLEIEARAETLWNERSEFGRAPRLISDARDTLAGEATAENRERLDALVEKYGTPEQCSAEEDIRNIHLAQIERKVPAAAYPVLRRLLLALGEIRAEMADTERKAFEEVGFIYNDDADASPVHMLVIQTAHELGQIVAKIQRGQYIGAQSPSALFGKTRIDDKGREVFEGRFFDLAKIKKENLSPTLPVPHDQPEPVAPISAREQDWRDGLDKPSPAQGRATGKPLVDIPGVTFAQYGGAQPEAFSSDGAFSKELGRVAALPSRI